MTEDELRHELAVASNTWASKQAEADTAKIARDELVAAAVDAGISSREIARLAHLSSPGVGMVARRMRAS